MFDAIGKIGLNAVKTITDLWAAGTADSLIDYTSPSRVEPIVLIDSDALYHEALVQVQQSLLSQFAGYYLQAIAISATVGKVNVSRHLDKLNPSRNPINSAVNSIGYLMAAENYSYKLPMYSENTALAMETRSEDIAESKLYLERQKYVYQRSKDTTDYAQRVEQAQRTWVQNQTKIGIDAAAKRAAQDVANANLQINKDNAAFDQKKFEEDVKRNGFDQAMKELQADNDKARLDLDKKRYDDTHNSSEFMVGRDTLTVIRELSDLSVGKLFTVEITDGLHKASIPISIRLMASQLPSNNLVNILALGNQDNSVKERYYAWKDGRIEFIKDLVLCQDLIDAHRKNLMADKTGIYAEILKRRRGNQVSGLVTANPSVATASNIVILTNDTAEQLEMRVNGKLGDFKTRERIFKETYIMMMAVIDKKWNRVTFYHRGIATHTELGMSDLKSSSKGNGPDVSEILKAFSTGHSPSL